MLVLKDGIGRARSVYYDPETITDSPDRDYGSTRGYSNESEFTVVKVRYRYIS